MPTPTVEVGMNDTIYVKSFQTVGPHSMLPLSRSVQSKHQWMEVIGGQISLEAFFAKAA